MKPYNSALHFGVVVISTICLTTITFADCKNYKSISILDKKYCIEKGGVKSNGTTGASFQSTRGGVGNFEVNCNFPIEKGTRKLAIKLSQSSWRAQGAFGRTTPLMLKIGLSNKRIKKYNHVTGEIYNYESAVVDGSPNRATAPGTEKVINLKAQDNYLNVYFIARDAYNTASIIGKFPSIQISDEPRCRTNT